MVTKLILPVAGENRIGVAMKSPSHHNNLDALRALAICAVIAHHMVAYAGIQIPYIGEIGGGLGVQLFFLVSGYLIVQSAERNTFQAYAVARIFRIFPAYWVVLFTVWVLEYLVNPSFKSVVDDGYAYLVLNILNLQQLSVRSNLFLDRLHVGWTLTVEMFWYVLAFALVWWDRRAQRPHFWLWVLASSTLLTCIWVPLADTGVLDILFADQAKQSGVEFTSILRHVHIKSSIVAYLYIFVLGAVLFKYQRTLVKIPSSLLWPVMIVLLAYWQEWQAVVGFAPQPLTALGLGCLFLLALKLPPLQDSIINFTGRISYALYLVHAKVMVVVYLNLKWTGASTHVLVLVTILLLAVLVHYLVELPMIRFGKRFRQQRQPDLSVAVTMPRPLAI